jgi:hypothetical protein
MLKFAFKDVSTKKNSEPTYWTILFAMLKIYFIYKVAGKKSKEFRMQTGRHFYGMNKGKVFISCVLYTNGYVNVIEWMLFQF